MVTAVLLLSILASTALAHPQLGGEWPFGGHGGAGVAVGVYVGPFGQYEGMNIQIQMIIQRVCTYFLEKLVCILLGVAFTRTIFYVRILLGFVFVKYAVNSGIK